MLPQHAGSLIEQSASGLAQGASEGRILCGPGNKSKIAAYVY
jgi:hypothetical protein